jgi:calmodulin
MPTETLTNEEIEACRDAFQKFDRDGSGAIDSFELRATLKAMGQEPTDEELFDMIAEVDGDGSGEIGASARAARDERPLYAHQ